MMVTLNEVLAQPSRTQALLYWPQLGPALLDVPWLKISDPLSL